MFRLASTLVSTRPTVLVMPVHGNRHTYIPTHGQTDRHTYIPTHGQTNRQKEMLMIFVVFFVDLIQVGQHLVSTRPIVLVMPVQIHTPTYRHTERQSDKGDLCC